MSIYPRLWPVSGALPRSGYIPKPRVRAPIGHRPGTVLAWSALVGVGRRTLGEQAATTLRTAKRCNIRGTLSGCEGSLLFRHWNLTLGAWAIVVLSLIGLAQQSARAQNSVAGWADKDWPQVPPAPAASVVFNNLPTALRNGRFESDEDEQ